MENLNTALSLLAVGMIMVFVILCLVIVIGNLVVRLTNRFIPEAAVPETGNSGGGASSGKKASTKKLAAIVAAVDVVTQGTGSVQSIEKK